MLQTHQPALSQYRPTGPIILIVEEDEANADFLVAAILQETSYIPVVATSSQQAQEILHYLSPDMFILNCHAGKKHCLEFYDQLQASSATFNVPTIILSTRIEKLQPELSQRHLIGLNKPFELEDFLAVLEQMSRLAQSSAPLQAMTYH